MDTRQTDKTTNIINSFKILKGNTRTSIIFEPLWGIPFVLFNFYLSLYMKELGITDEQIGYLISIGFITGAFFSIFGGVITDRLGRKKTTLIFDFISWPVTMLVYLISNNFWMFALATVINSTVRIVAVSWNLMVIEDADDGQRIAAFNLLNIINISTGVIIPVAGLLVNAYGVVTAERIFLAYAAVSMTLMIALRNHFYTETGIGKQILEEKRKEPVLNSLKNVFPIEALKVFKERPSAAFAVIVFVLFNLYMPLGTLNSLYFAPYMTEALMLDKSAISILGGVYSAVLFAIFVFINPLVSKFNNIMNMVTGLVIQVLSLLLLVIIPAGNFIAALLSIILYAAGFGIFRPFIDSLLAGATEGKERASIYSILNTLTCVFTALIGFFSGSMYVFNPRLIYIASILILLAIIVILTIFFRTNKSNSIGSSF